MTRENKLALIVGFSIILVVGVLVSDHFSKARQAQLTQVQDDPRSVSGDLVDPLTRDDDSTIADSYRRTPGLERSGATGHGLLSEALDSAPSQEPELALSDPDPLGDTQDPLEGASAAPIVIHQGSPPAETSTLAMDDPLAELMRKARENGVPLTTSTASMPESRSVNVPEPKRTVAQPTYGEYVVQKDDSLYSISKRFLGSGERWKELRDLNKDRLPNGEVLRIGIRLRVPASREATSTPTKTDRPATSAPTKTPTKTESKASREYEVKSGDTLGQIAQRECGSAKRVEEILELNKDRIDDADEIYVGMKLRLPSR
ncbi:MAG: LysM peptidoglycan-binding domain-containing protein [Phycisphaerales bacterium]